MHVTLSDQGVLDSKNLPRSVRTRINRFAKELVPHGETIKLKGYTLQNGRIRWVFPKKGNAEFAQQLRNFMSNEVYL